MLGANDGGEQEEVVDNGDTRNRFGYVVGVFINDEELRKQTPPRPVCVTAFKEVYGIGKKRLTRLQNSIKEVVIINTLF